MLKQILHTIFPRAYTCSCTRACCAGACLLWCEAHSVDVLNHHYTPCKYLLNVSDTLMLLHVTQHFLMSFGGRLLGLILPYPWTYPTQNWETLVLVVLKCTRHFSHCTFWCNSTIKIINYWWNYVSKYMLVHSWMLEITAVPLKVHCVKSSFL